MTPKASATDAMRWNSVMPPQTAASVCKTAAACRVRSWKWRHRPASISPVATLIGVRRASRAWFSMSSGPNGSSIQYGFQDSNRLTASRAVGRSRHALLASSIASTSGPTAERTAARALVFGLGRPAYLRLHRTEAKFKVGLHLGTRIVRSFAVQVVSAAGVGGHGICRRGAEIFPERLSDGAYIKIPQRNLENAQARITEPRRPAGSAPRWISSHRPRTRCGPGRPRVARGDDGTPTRKVGPASCPRSRSRCLEHFSGMDPAPAYSCGVTDRRRADRRPARQAGQRTVRAASMPLIRAMSGASCPLLLTIHQDLLEHTRQRTRHASKKKKTADKNIQHIRMRTSAPDEDPIRCRRTSTTCIVDHRIGVLGLADRQQSRLRRTVPQLARLQ